MIGTLTHGLATPLPLIGGRCFATRQENVRIAGARFKSPYLEIREYRQMVEEKKKSDRRTEARQQTSDLTIKTCGRCVRWYKKSTPRGEEGNRT